MVVVAGKIVERKKITGLGFQLNGIKLEGSVGPMGIRGTTIPLARSHWVRSVPAWRPILTPSSVMGTNGSGEPVDFAIALRLSSGCVTIAHRPNEIGAR